MAQQKEKLPYSKVKQANELVFISGQIGQDNRTGKLADDSFEAEVNQVMKNMGQLLQEQGLDFADLVNVTIYLKNMDNYSVTNKVYTSFFKENYPARVCIAVADLPSKANIEIAAIALKKQDLTLENKEMVRQFLEVVRSGKHPDQAVKFMTDTLLAHQMNAEEETAVKRTPQNYADHVREFLALYGDFSFEITELIASGDKVYARWKQTGKHLGTIDGHAAKGKTLVEITSAVYRLEHGKIVEYWIQTDREGLTRQLESGR